MREVREEEGCPFGQQAETGQHRSLDVPTPPFTGAGARNVVEQGPSCRFRGTTPCTGPRTYPFPPIPSGTCPPPPAVHTACEHRIGILCDLFVHIPQGLLPQFHSGSLPGRSVAVFRRSTAVPPAAHMASEHRIGPLRDFRVHIPQLPGAGWSVTGWCTSVC